MEEAIPLNPSQIYSPAKLAIPRDDEDKRYVKSFSVKEKAAFTKFYKKYGFVVIRDVLTGKECEKTIDELWSYVEKREFDLRSWLDEEMASLVEAQVDRQLLVAALNKSAIHRDDPRTWSNDWPPLDSAG